MNQYEVTVLDKTGFELGKICFAESFGEVEEKLTKAGFQVMSISVMALDILNVSELEASGDGV